MAPSPNKTSTLKGSATHVTLRAALKLAERYETGQQDAITQVMGTHWNNEAYGTILNKITTDLLALARRELSVRQAASDTLMAQDVSVQLARVVIAAIPFARLFLPNARPRFQVWEALVAVTAVAFVHEDAGTPSGARKLREEIDRVFCDLFEEG